MTLVIRVLVLVARHVAGAVGEVLAPGHAFATPCRVEAKFVRACELLGVCEAVDGAALDHTLKGRKGRAMTS